MDGSDKKSPSIDSGRGSSGDKHRFFEGSSSIDSTQSSKFYRSVSQYSLSSNKSESSAGIDAEEVKKKQRSATLPCLSFMSKSSKSGGGLKLSESLECLPQEKKKKRKIRNPFKKKSKEVVVVSPQTSKNISEMSSSENKLDEVMESEQTHTQTKEKLDAVAENMNPAPTTSELLESPELKKLKKKLSLIRSFRKKLKEARTSLKSNTNTSKGETSGIPAVVQSPVLNSESSQLFPHLVDLEVEPKRLESYYKTSSLTPTTQDFNPQSMEFESQIENLDQSSQQLDSEKFQSVRKMQSEQLIQLRSTQLVTEQFQTQSPQLVTEQFQTRSPQLYSEQFQSQLQLQNMILSHPNQSESMDTFLKTNVQSDTLESSSSPPPPVVNFSLNTQRIKPKKPNLQRATVERIFLQQRRDSENEPEVINGEEPSATAPLSESSATAPLSESSATAPLSESSDDTIISEELTSEKLLPTIHIEYPKEKKDFLEDSEVEIIEEYAQYSASETINMPMDYESFNAFQKRLSIISEAGSDIGSDYSTARRASDFTDSFKKLEPFKFDLPAVVEGKRERLYKVLVVGELGTGKTSIIKRYVHQFFSQHYRATIGVDFALKVLRWDPETVVRLQLWDIAGQERFGSMTRVYYKEAVGAFVVFDVTRSATLDAVPKWKQDLDSKVVLPDGRPIPAVLLANKSDQPKEGLAANREKMNEFCQQQGFSAWFETSAKDNINIDESANFLVSKILEMDKWSQEPLASDHEKVALAGSGRRNGTSNGCAC